MNQAKFGNPDLQNDVIDLLKETAMPVSIEFIAQKMNLGWGTARAILLNLSLQGTVKMEKTTKSFIFSLTTETKKHE